MLRNYFAVDLRGHKNEYFKTVVSLEKSKGDYYAVELLPEYFSQRKKIIKKENPDLVFAQGGDLIRNRKILEAPEVDILSKPYPIDDTLAKIASRNDKAFEVCIKDIILTHGYLRARLLQSLMNTIKVAVRRDVFIAISTGSTGPTDMIVPREMVAFGTVLGLTYLQSKAAIGAVPDMILEGRRQT
ncbi:MAG: RNase P subunit p30 family protein [Candidatus Methanofastidiosia archaeon]